MPPAALTPQRAAGHAAHQGHIGRGCAAGGKAGRGLDEVRARLDGDLRAAQLFFHAQQGGLQNHLEQRAVMMGDGGRGVDGVLDGLVVAALELADGDHHVQLARSQASQRRRLLAQRGDQRRAQRKADHHAHGNAGAGERRPPWKPRPG